MSRQTLIGIDIGTTSVKAVMIGTDGQRLAESCARYPTSHPAAGLAEQDPADWLRLVLAALTDFDRHPARGDLRAICLTSQVNTHVFVDAALAVLHPALVWQDGRAAGAGVAIDAGISAAEKIGWLGAPIPVDASHALARMGWMADAHPELWAQTAHVLLPRDFVLARLCGRVVSDPISAVGLVGTDLTYAAALIALVPGAAGRLPPLADPLAVVGQIGKGFPCAGVPLVLGTMDAWASMFGLGVVAEGQAMYLSGTSEVLGLISDMVTAEPGVITFAPWSGITLHAGPTQGGGASLGWLSRLLGRPEAELAAMAAPITAQSPLFLPHLSGERAPIWDAQARGAFAGLTSGTGPAEMAAAVLEGVAFSARLALEALQRSGGVVPERLRCGGGGAASDRWCQIRADALGRVLIRMQGSDPGAVGAAVMAGVGSGLMPDLAQAAQRLVLEDRRFVPDPQAAKLAEARFALWQQLYQQMRPINAGLA
ncbi:xylulokinase [Rhodobacter ferrooxidans]|uniref:Carbohydrate kinase FGGY n=1 Tax=Rhodobacter ferrooxidans TaxID=371731 RepID=C8RW88_9RHOB|nr:FGGY-family carbohydrate kinase [Rhodobacter sp. SW2]EEW26831.1 carbohydrate kinase FGGY [Rhodobacter sp. SW2]